MTNLETMEVGEKRSLGDSMAWEGPEGAKAAYYAAQEVTRKTGKLFEISVRRVLLPVGIEHDAGYDITRTR